ncbi:tungstate ABC transporter substrate-binding protein WtpA [Candidatus Latescibacterota bacterium]
MMIKVPILLTIVMTLNQTLSGDENKSPISGDLIIFHAGSLAVPFKGISEKFTQEYPDVRILSESAGSRTCARKITDLERSCDVMASADYTVIDELLIPEYADWNLKFASNEMTIVYTDASRKSAEINETNWYRILLDENVIFGRSDPDSDPCGYRAVLTIKLAEEFYNEPGLAKNFLVKNLNYIRPKEVDLLALLETGNIDYIFLYRSVAQQHGLKYILLPDEINLKKPELSDYYKKARIKISGKTPGSFIEKIGEPMIYSITIPRNAPNPAAALEFVLFLLEKDRGLAIMERNGQPSIIPTSTNTFNRLPEILKKYATQ